MNCQMSRHHHFKATRRSELKQAPTTMPPMTQCSPKSPLHDKRGKSTAESTVPLLTFQCCRNVQVWGAFSLWCNDNTSARNLSEMIRARHNCTENLIIATNSMHCRSKQRRTFFACPNMHAMHTPCTVFCICLTSPSTTF